jgi:hypothetical protein
MTIRYTERDATSGNDFLTGASNTITFGMGGNDIFQAAPNPTGGQVFVGGAGSDTYIAAPNSAMTIADMGNGAPNTLVALGIGINSSTSFSAIVDGRHFLALDTATGESVLAVDWLLPANRIDTIQLRDGTFTIDQLVTAVNTGALGTHFLGNITSTQAGLIPAGQTQANVNEAISYYEARALSMLTAPAVNPLEQALVDPNFYLAKNADVSSADVDPAVHFITSGWHEGRAPDAFFDVSYYLAHNPDIAAAGIDPLMHYALFGWKEGRDPSAAFSTSHYLAANADVKLAGIDPLQHYLQFGLAEHRPLG